MKGLVASPVLIAIASPAGAQFLDGNKLQAFCKDFPEEAASYAVGVIDSAYLYQSLMGVKDRICIPEGVDVYQVRDVACKYLEDKPEDRHMLASDLVAESAAAAWPCK